MNRVIIHCEHQSRLCTQRNNAISYRPRRFTVAPSIVLSPVQCARCPEQALILMNEEASVDKHTHYYILCFCGNDGEVEPNKCDRFFHRCTIQRFRYFANRPPYTQYLVCICSIEPYMRDARTCVFQTYTTTIENVYRTAALHSG